MSENPDLIDAIVLMATETKMSAGLACVNALEGDSHAYRKALPGVATVVAAIFVLGVSNAVAGDSDLVAKYDKDNDKSLDLNEVSAAASAHFDKLNKHGDSTLEAKEVKGIIGPSAFKAADADHDGTLSKDEYLALVAKLFKQADTDHDGSLDCGGIPFNEWPSSEAACQLTRAGAPSRANQLAGRCRTQAPRWTSTCA